MKKYIALFLVFILAPILFACDQTTTTTTEITTTTTTIEFDYTMFVSLWVTDPSQQLNVSDEPYYIYYYGLTCSHCNAIKQEVLTKIASLNEDHVYLVSVTSTSSVGSGIGVTSTPAIVYVVDHQVSGIHVGETSVLEIIQGLS